MSFEEKLVQIIGILFVLYFCIKTILISTIRAYKEIYIEIRQSVQEIKEKGLSDEIENHIDKVCGLEYEENKR